MLKEEAKSTPTDTIESLRENIGIKPNIQNIDTRLLLGRDNTLTAEAFLTIVRDYNLLNRTQAIRVFERYADIFPLAKQRVNFLQK
jgi:hypothetical protein